MLTKKIQKLDNSGSSSDVLLSEKFLWMLSAAYSLLFRVSVIKMSSSCPLYSILTSIFSFSLINCSISKSHLQSSATCWKYVIIFLAFQTPKQALQVLQTPFCCSTLQGLQTHLPFMYLLVLSREQIHCDVRRSPGASFSPEIACSSNIPDSGKHHVRSVLLAEDRPCLLPCCCMHSLRSQQPSYPCHPIRLPASAGLEAPELSPNQTLIPVTCRSCWGWTKSGFPDSSE